MGTDAYILDGVRTPIGKYGGALAGVRPDDLAAGVIRGLLDRTHALDPSDVDDVFFGDANGAGEDNRNVARMATLLAGMPPSVPGVTVNRLCASGMEAVVAASRAVLAGDCSIAVAGGVESMSRAPWILLKNSRGYPAANETLHSSTLGWRMVNPAMPPSWTVSLGEATEQLADKLDITREQQDEFAAASHQKAVAAWESGAFASEIVWVPGQDIARDESIRPDTTVETLARLVPAFRPDGTVTAGNSSPLNDGAAALLLGDGKAADRLGVQPLARIVSRGLAAVEPQDFGIGPVRAAEVALDRAGLSWADLDYVELNEAFAAQSLACLRLWPDLDPETVNVHGGAIALGHPLGCSGARIIAHLAHVLRANGGGYGLATLCVGVGQGVAIILEA